MYKEKLKVITQEKALKGTYQGSQTKRRTLKNFAVALIFNCLDFQHVQQLGKTTLKMTSINTMLLSWLY